MQRCPYCSRPSELVLVHGHDQCRHCGINVQPCCSGEQCEPPDVEEGRNPTADSRQPGFLI